MSSDKVQKRLQQLKPRKAIGDDKIPPALTKVFAEPLGTLLSIEINNSFEYIWGTGVIARGTFIQVRIVIESNLNCMDVVKTSLRRLNVMTFETSISNPHAISYGPISRRREDVVKNCYAGKIAALIFHVRIGFNMLA